MPKEIYPTDNFLQDLKYQGRSRVLNTPEDLKAQENIEFNKEAHAEFIYKNFRSKQEGHKVLPN
jgi:hypothetical protein